MAPIDEMQRLQLSDGEPDSPPPPRRTRSKSNTSSTERAHGSGIDHEEAREAALRKELQTVQNVNRAIEGVIESLERAKGNMEVRSLCTTRKDRRDKRVLIYWLQTVSRTVQSASQLLSTWTRILSQTEHHQRLVLDPSWQGASHDIAELEAEALARQQEAERREQELRQRREEAARKAAEEQERKAAHGGAAAGSSRLARGTTAARVRSRVGTTGVSRVPSATSTGRTGVSSRTTRGGTTTSSTSASAARRAGSISARGTSVRRGPTSRT